MIPIPETVYVKPGELIYCDLGRESIRDLHHYFNIIYLPEENEMNMTAKGRGGDSSPESYQREREEHRQYLIDKLQNLEKTVEELYHEFRPNSDFQRTYTDAEKKTRIDYKVIITGIMRSINHINLSTPYEEYLKKKEKIAKLQQEVNEYGQENDE